MNNLSSSIFVHVRPSMKQDLYGSTKFIFFLYLHNLMFHALLWYLKAIGIMFCSVVPSLAW